jgi:phthalate 4,5-dioxygenase
MGPIYDRTQARLGTSDVMVIRTRKRLLDAVQALRDRGQSPPSVDNPEVYAIRSGGVVLPRTANWLEATTELRRGWAKHPDLTRDVLGGVPAV